MNKGRQASGHHDHHDYTDRLRVPSLPVRFNGPVSRMRPPRQSARYCTFAQREVQWAVLGSNQ